MSLIICSSQQDRYNEEEQGNAKPASFSNYLGNAMMIPSHSEVAVQSVKINRQGQITITEGINDFGYIWFGGDYDTTLGDNKLSILNDYALSLLPFKFKEGDYTVDSFATMAVRVLKEACAYHPDLECDGVVPRFNATTFVFEGFDWKLGQLTSTLPDVVSDLVPRPVLSDEAVDEYLVNNGVVPVTIPDYDAVSAWQGGTTATPNVATWDPTNRHLKAQGVAGQTVAIFPQASMSWCGGSISYEIINAPIGDPGATANSPKYQWAVGLTRAQRNGTSVVGGEWESLNDMNYSLPVINVPPAGQTNWNAQWAPRRLFPGKNEQDWFDYKVVAEKDGTDYFLHVYASGHRLNPPNDDTRLDVRKTTNNKVEYWKDTGSGLYVDGSGPYNIGTNTLGITHITFTCKGDNISIGYVGTTPVEASGVIVLSETDGGTQFCPPVTGTKMRLYPKITLKNEVGKYIKISSMTGRTHPAIKPFGSGWYEDNWEQPKYLFGEDSNSSDSRRFNCVNGGDGWVGLHAGGFIDYKIMIINTEQNGDEDSQISPGEITDGANSLDTFSVKGDEVLIQSEGVAQGNKGTTWSGSLPPSSSRSSYFITCPTLTQESQNFGKGTPSKILYHIPQFSNAGEDVGALFFEPGEKTYIRLGNTEKLSINTLDINIVDKNEQVVQDLDGNTVVVLHIRKER